MSDKPETTETTADTRRVQRCLTQREQKILDRALRRSIRTLVDKQQPLGEPFSTILYENLWELYERS